MNKLTKQRVYDEILNVTDLYTGRANIKAAPIAAKLGVSGNEVNVAIRTLVDRGDVKVIENNGRAGRVVEIPTLARGVTKTTHVAPEIPFIPARIPTKDEHKTYEQHESELKKASHHKIVLENSKAVLYASENFTMELMRQVMALRNCLEEVLKEFDNKK